MLVSERLTAAPGLERARFPNESRRSSDRLLMWSQQHEFFEARLIVDHPGPCRKPGLEFGS